MKLKEFKRVTNKLKKGQFINVYISNYSIDGEFWRVEDNKLFMEHADSGIDYKRIVSIDPDGVDFDWQNKKQKEYDQDHHSERFNRSISDDDRGQGWTWQGAT